MTTIEYIERDIKKRACAVSQAIRKPNVTQEELTRVKTNLAVAVKIKDILEKQTAKKPIELTDRYPSGQFECPNCGAGVGWHTTYNTPFGEMQSDKMHKKKYCECCGQKIDWGDNNGNA